MTKIKKRDLRKRLPQVPINYPGPDVIPFDYENEKAKVENLCKRLADNEAEVRDAVLAELPRYLKEVCTNFTVGTTTLADVERAAAATIDLASFDAGTQLWDALMKDPSAVNLALLLEKLCLGLFYCLWHSDKPLVQHECSLKIVQLIGAMPTALLKDLFVRSMLRTLVRHWSKIDQWRMDKYMAMVRKLCYEVISHLAAEVTAAPPVAATSSPAEATPAKSAGKKSGKTPAKAPKTVEVPKEDTEATNSIDIASAARHPTLLRIASTFQWDVIRSEVGVGLTMHMADLFLTEMMRCEALTVEQFVAVAAAIPLYIMQRGNYIEKRVMDNFVVPIAAGALEKRSQDFSIQVASILAVQFEAMSVSRSTHFNVRPLMFEAQRLMENYVGVTTQPELFEMVTKRDERSRMAKEIRAAEDVKMRLSQIAMKHAAAEGVVRAARRAAKPQPTSKRSARWKKF